MPLRGRSFPAFCVRDRADTVDDLTPAIPRIRNIPEFPIVKGFLKGNAGFVLSALGMRLIHIGQTGAGCYRILGVRCIYRSLKASALRSSNGFRGLGV